MNDAVAEFPRYANLIRQALPAAGDVVFTAETPATVQVERGVVLRDAMATQHDAARNGSLVDRPIDLSMDGVERLAQVAFVDAAGQARPVYRPLAIYAWLTAYRIAYESLPPSIFGRWDEALRPWCDLLEGELGPITIADAGTPAIRGGSAAEAAWTALALYAAGKVFVRDAWTDLAADTFGRLARGQQAGGAFLLPSSSDHPEVSWYHELAILHAAASYAVQAEDRTVARAVARSASFVLDEIEPDHATAQPWGIFAFIWNPAARPLADQQLHAVDMRRDRLDGVSLILLADALYCLRLFLDPDADINPHEPNS